MKVFMLSVGTHGDIRPFVALGKNMIAQGHTVTLCTTTNFEPFVREHGLRFAPLNDDILNLMDDAKGREMLEKANGVMGYINAFREGMKLVKPLYSQMLREAWQGINDADVIIAHPKSLAGYHMAEALKIPYIMVLTVPLLVPTVREPAFIAPKLPLGAAYNHLTYRLVEIGTRMSLMGIINEWRKSDLNLPKRSRFATELKTPQGKPTPVMHCVSPHVYPTPDDWYDEAILTGYWFLDHDENYIPSPDLIDFIKAGKPPIYIGFGSIAGTDPQKTTRIVMDALKKSGQRAILATGWGGMVTTSLPSTVFRIESAPHSWLFKHVSAVVHHGGAGTTAAGLRAGKPTIILPFTADQPFWGEKIHQAGLGPEPIHQKKLTADNLAQAITTAVTDTKIRTNAEAIAEKLSVENGIENALQFIEKIVS